MNIIKVLLIITLIIWITSCQNEEINEENIKKTSKTSIIEDNSNDLEIINNTVKNDIKNIIDEDENSQKSAMVDGILNDIIENNLQE